MDSRGVFSPEALRPHLSMGLPLYGIDSKQKWTGELRSASRWRILRRTAAKSFVSSMSYVTSTVCNHRHSATISPTRHRLAKRHTRREAGSQNHGSPVSGTTAGLPNQIQCTMTCDQELAELRSMMKGRKDQEKQDTMTPLGNAGRLRPPLFSARCRQ